MWRPPQSITFSWRESFINDNLRILKNIQALVTGRSISCDLSIATLDAFFHCTENPWEPGHGRSVQPGEIAIKRPTTKVRLLKAGFTDDNMSTMSFPPNVMYFTTMLAQSYILLQYPRIKIAMKSHYVGHLELQRKRFTTLKAPYWRWLQILK